MNSSHNNSNNPTLLSSHTMDLKHRLLRSMREISRQENFFENTNSNGLFFNAFQSNDSPVDSTKNTTVSTSTITKTDSAYNTTIVERKEIFRKLE